MNYTKTDIVFDFIAEHALLFVSFIAAIMIACMAFGIYASHAETAACHRAGGVMVKTGQHTQITTVNKVIVVQTVNDYDCSKNV